MQSHGRYLKWAQNVWSFISHRFELAIPEAHVEEVLIDTLHKAVIITATLHSVQNILHPAKMTTTKL
jgi:hypothetical protein